jgi:hypothetical protein
MTRRGAMRKLSRACKYLKQRNRHYSPTTGRFGWDDANDLTAWYILFNLWGEVRKGIARR